MQDKAKTKEVRLKEMLVIYGKLRDLGLNEEVCAGLKEFKSVVNRFVKEGFSMQGRIQLYEINRVLEYRLSVLPHIQSSVNLANVVGGIAKN